VKVQVTFATKSGGTERASEATYTALLAKMALIVLLATEASTFAPVLEASWSTIDDDNRIANFTKWLFLEHVVLSRALVKQISSSLLLYSS
jgi:hypothetical protein